MRASQRNRLIWNLEQIQRLSAVDDDTELGNSLIHIEEFANAAMKIVRADEAKFAGRVPPIPPRRLK